MSKKTVGGVSHSLCMAYFSAIGHRVSLPIFDDAPYDLISDDGVTMKKIQCKTAMTGKPQRGKTIYPRINFSADKNHNPVYVESFDSLWVLTNQYCYLIPSDVIPHKADNQLRSISIGKKYSQFIVDIPFLKGKEPINPMDMTPLSELEKRRIESLYFLGESARSIGVIMGLKIHKVEAYLSKSGTFKSRTLDDKTKSIILQRYKDGKRVGDIAKEIGYSRQTVANIVRDSGLLKTKPPVLKPEWKSDIIQMYKDQIPVINIAAKYNVRPNAVSTFINHQRWLLDKSTAPTSGI